MPAPRSQPSRSLALIFASYLLVALPFGLLTLQYDRGQLLALVAALALVAPGVSALLLWPRSGRASPSLWESVPGRMISVLPVGHAFAALLLRQWVQLPPEECLKFLVSGIPVLIICVALTYFTQPDGQSTLATGRIGLRAKFWASLLAVALITTVGLGVHAYASAQRLLAGWVTEMTRHRLDGLAQQIETGQKWTWLLEFQGAEQVAVVEPGGAVITHRGPDPEEPFLQDVGGLVAGSEGVHHVHRRTSRVVAWREINEDSTIVAVVPLSQYSDQLAGVVQGTLPVALLSLLTAGLFGWLLARSLLRPLRALTDYMRSFPESRSSRLMPAETDDEVGVLVRNFRLMMGELSRAHESLQASNLKTARVLAEKVEKVEQLGALFEISRALSQGSELDRALAAVLARSCELAGADCGLVLLRRGDRLVRACELGFPEPRPDLEAGDSRELACSLGQARIEHGPIPPAFRSLAQAVGATSVTRVPLSDQSTPVGLMLLFHGRDASVEACVLRLLTSVAQQTAAGVRKAFSLEQAEEVSEVLRRALTPPRSLDAPGLVVGHLYVPSRELSGDYYDVIRLDDHRSGIVMADVAGKGPQAAAYAVQLRSTIRSLALAGENPSGLLASLNDQVVEGPHSRLVTVFYAEYDARRMRLSMASAGHEPPLLVSRGLVESIELGDLVVGVQSGVVYRSLERTVRPGDCLLLFTDGITEARTPDGEFFGAEGVERVLRTRQPHSPQAAVNGVFSRAYRHCRGGFADDVSLMAMRFEREV